MRIIKQEKASVLLMVFMFSLVLSGLVMAYLNLVGVFSKATGYKTHRYRAIGMAEAGVNRVAAYLENTAPDASTTGIWRNTVTQTLTFTESGLSRNYTYTAAAGTLNLEGPLIAASSALPAFPASNVMDKSATTYWRSITTTGTRTLTFTLGIPADYTANRDSSIYVGRTRMILGTGTLAQFPRIYTWQTSINGAAWTTVVTRTATCDSANSCDFTDTFTIQRANYLRLNVTAVQGAATNPVNIAEIEIFGAVAPATVTDNDATTASDSSAVDNSLATFWQSSVNLPKTFTFTFPRNAAALSYSNYSINKIRMRLGTGASWQRFPQDYTWSVSPSTGNCLTAAYVEVVNRSGFNCNSSATCDVTDTFSLSSGGTNVNCLQLNVTVVQAGGSRVEIGEIDVPAVCLSSVCSVTLAGRVISYYAAQNVIVDGSPPSVNRQPKMIFGVESGS